MKTVGIDIGTTSISGVVYDEGTGTVIVSKSVEHHAAIDTPNVWEKMQNPGLLVDLAKAVLDELLEKEPEVKKIGLTGQMHGIVYLDSEGRAVSPLYTWQDQRGSLDLTEGRVVDVINQDGGSPVANGYGLVTHIFNLLCDCCPFEAVNLATIMDYFGMVLTGRKTPLVHTSNAASFGFFDVKRGIFETERLERYGVITEILPDITPYIEVLGEYRGIPVTCAIGDNQASYLGSVGSVKEAALLNLGTGGQISVRTETYAEIEGIDTRPFIDGEYLLVGASLGGGKAYAVLEQFFREIVNEAAGCDMSMYEVMERLARKAAPGDLKVSPQLYGTRQHPEYRGSIIGLSEENFHAGSLIYAYMQGMIRELYEIYKQMGVSASELYGAGNGLRRNELLCIIAREMFGMELKLSHLEEEAACGAAMSSLHARDFSHFTQIVKLQ